MIDGHVATTDVNIFKQNCLKIFWVQGRKYRPRCHINGMKQAIEHGLAEYIQQFIDFEEVIPLWREWAQIVMAQVEKRVTEVLSDINQETKQAEVLSVEANEELLKFTN